MDALLTANSSLRLPWAHGADPATRYLAKLSAGSIPTQKSGLWRIAELITGRAIDPALLPWHLLTITQADALAAKIREKYATRTANRLFACVRGVLNVCRKEGWFIVREGVAQRDHFDALASCFKDKKPRGDKHGRHLTDSEITALFASCERDSAFGLRDAAILALGVGAGLRRAEIAALRLENIDLKTGRVAILAGKGDKDRVAVLPPQALAHVARWIAARKRDDRLLGLSARGVWLALRARTAAAGVREFTPHDLRRTYATRALRAKVPYGVVQNALGHESIKTTAGYDLTPEDEMIAALRKVDLPGAPSSAAAEQRELARRICRRILDDNARLDHGDVVTKGMVEFVMKELNGARG